MAFDLILEHGTVLDGTGRDGFPASVAIADGRIAAVGVLDDASTARRIDCTGQVIAPGFIDMHSHSDWVIPQPDHAEVLAPLLEQGITTVVGGNCGCSPAPTGCWVSPPRCRSAAASTPRTRAATSRSTTAPRPTSRRPTCWRSTRPLRCGAPTA